MPRKTSRAASKAPPRRRGKGTAPSTTQAEPKARTGRPTGYSEEMAKRALKLAILGLRDEDMALALGISERTLNNWKRQHPDFMQALKAGKTEADSNVSGALYRRAIGFSRKIQKPVLNRVTGQLEILTLTEQVAPDTTACIFWLKNRQRDLWRDRTGLDLGDANGDPLPDRFQVDLVPPDADPKA